jgi:NAD(P)H-dependent flavin oxidoreductase YrpB (nitropropane dioxygenase family)
MQSGGTTVQIPAYSGYLPEPDVRADIEHMTLYAGQSCGMVNGIHPAAEIIAEIIQQATATVTRLNAWSTAAL